MPVKCVKETAQNVTPTSHDVIGWHEPEGQKGQNNPPIPNEVRHKQKYVLVMAFRKLLVLLHDYTGRVTNVV